MEKLHLLIISFIFISFVSYASPAEENSFILAVNKNPASEKHRYEYAEYLYSEGQFEKVKRELGALFRMESNHKLGLKLQARLKSHEARNQTECLMFLKNKYSIAKSQLKVQYVSPEKEREELGNVQEKIMSSSYDEGTLLLRVLLSKYPQSAAVGRFYLKFLYHHQQFNEGVSQGLKFSTRFPRDPEIKVRFKTFQKLKENSQKRAPRMDLQEALDCLAKF